MKQLPDPYRPKDYRTLLTLQELDDLDGEALHFYALGVQAGIESCVDFQLDHKDIRDSGYFRKILYKASDIVDESEQDNS